MESRIGIGKDNGPRIRVTSPRLAINNSETVPDGAPSELPGESFFGFRTTLHLLLLAAATGIAVPAFRHVLYLR